MDEDGVVGRQDRPAAVAEDDLDTLVGQDLDDHLGAGHCPPGQRVAVVAGDVVALSHSCRFCFPHSGRE
jgi:hypothetical protein